MYTVCPKCALTLVVSAADLRVAQGFVRCGRCSNVFNALARLSEDRNLAANAAPQPAPAPSPQAPSQASSPQAPAQSGSTQAGHAQQAAAPDATTPASRTPGPVPASPSSPQQSSA